MAGKVVKLTMMIDYGNMMPMSCITDSNRSIDEALVHNDPPTVIANLNAYKHNFLVFLGKNWHN